MNRCTDAAGQFPALAFPGPCRGRPASPRALAGTAGRLPASHGAVQPAGLGTAGERLNCDLAGAPPVLRFSTCPMN